MKTKLHFLLLTLFFASQATQAQAALDNNDTQASSDEQFVANRKSMEATTQTRYYYYPNLQAYYDTRSALFIYQQDGQWITSETINPNARGYCVKNGMYVILKGYYDDEPYKKLAEHRKEYPADFSSRPKPPTVIDYAAKTKKANTGIVAN